MRRKLSVLLFLSLMFLSGCFEQKDLSKYDRAMDDKIIEIEHDYSEILEYQISWSKVLSLDVEFYYVYFYSETCSNCQEIKNRIIEKALERNNIFFVRSSNSDRIEKDIKNTIGARKMEDFAILGYPSLAKIQQGICVENKAGKTQILAALN